MSYGFEANPENLIDKGNRIVKLFDDYTALLRNANEVGDEVTRIWEGADAVAYNNALKGYDSTFKIAGEKVDEIGRIIGNHGNRLAEQRENIMKKASEL